MRNRTIFKAFCATFPHKLSVTFISSTNEMALYEPKIPVYLPLYVAAKRFGNIFNDDRSMFLGNSANLIQFAGVYRKDLPQR